MSKVIVLYCPLLLHLKSYNHCFHQISAEGEDNREQLPWTIFRTFDSVSQGTNFSVVVSAEANNDYRHTSSAIFALDLDFFDNHASLYSNNNITLANSMSQLAFIEFEQQRNESLLVFSSWMGSVSNAQAKFFDEVTVNGSIEPTGWDWGSAPTVARTAHDSSDVIPSAIASFPNATAGNNTVSLRAFESGPGSITNTERSITIFPVAIPIPDITPPVVIITSPLNNSIVNGNLTIFSLITDNIGVANATVTAENSTSTTELCVLTSAPFNCVSFNTSDFSDNSEGYDLVVTARDTSNNIGIDSVHVTIDRNIPVFGVPQFEIIYPFDQFSIKNFSNLTIKVNVSDSREAGASAGINISRIFIAHLNGTGNVSMTFESGSTADNEFSIWNITVFINTLTRVTNVTFHIFDNSTPTNNLAQLTTPIGPDIVIDNNLPTWQNLVCPTQVDQSINFTCTTDAFDNFKLDNFSYAHNDSGSFLNTSELEFNFNLSDTAIISFNFTTVGNFSVGINIFDDARNLNSSGFVNVEVLPGGVVPPPVDSCTPPSSGNWVIACSDNCSIIEDQTIPRNISIVNGSGQVQFDAEFNFTNPNSFITIEPIDCRLNITQSYSAVR